jgi:high-affinity iron transporter
LGAFVITLREGFEAALLVGLMMAYLSKSGHLGTHARYVWAGVATGVALSVLVGGVLFASGAELEGTSEAIYEGIAMLLAAGVVTWMVFWMRRQAATIGGQLRAQVGEAIAAGGGIALAGVAFVGVGREGLETALFLFATTGESEALVSFAGAALGLAAAIALGVLFYRGALRLDLKRFFLVTSVLVIGFAAWLISGGLHELGEATGSEALEGLAPFAAILYATFFVGLYLVDARRARSAAPGPSGDAGREERIPTAVAPAGGIGARPEG